MPTSEPTQIEGTADLEADSKSTKSQRTRKKILEAAAAVFRDVGYANARLVDIAERAEMRAGSLYYHFDSREELVVEILRLGTLTAVDRVREAVDELPADATPIDRIETAVRQHTLALLEMGTYSSAHARIAGEIPAEMAHANERDQRAYSAYWNELLLDAHSQGLLASGLDLSAARMLAFGAMNWTTKWFEHGGRLSAEELADQAVLVIMGGLCAGR